MAARMVDGAVAVSTSHATAWNRQLLSSRIRSNRASIAAPLLLPLLLPPDRGASQTAHMFVAAPFVSVQAPHVQVTAVMTLAAGTKAGMGRTIGAAARIVVAWVATVMESAMEARTSASLCVFDCAAAATMTARRNVRESPLLTKLPRAVPPLAYLMVNK